MNLLLTSMLCLTVALLLLWGMLAPARIYQLPFLVGVMAMSFLLPQLPGLMDDRFLPPGAYERMVAFTILCLAAAWLGWSSTKKPVGFLRWTFAERRVLIVSAALSVIGAYFYFKLSRLPGDLVVGVQMSGVPVIYLFVARLMTYGLALGVICLARRTSLLALAIVAFDLVFYLDRIVVTGKRAEAIELVAIFAVAFWFHRGWLAPRMVARRARISRRSSSTRDPATRPSSAILPPYVRTWRLASNPAPPTRSRTAATPAPPVADLTASTTSSRELSMPASMPSSAARSSFHGVREVPMTRAPAAFPIWTADVPTPLPTPWINSVSPA